MNDMGGAASLPIRSLDQLLNRHFLTALPDAVSQIVVVVEIGTAKLAQPLADSIAASSFTTSSTYNRASRSN